MAGNYDIYPAVDDGYNFPQVIRQKLSTSAELGNAFVGGKIDTNNNLILTDRNGNQTTIPGVIGQTGAKGDKGDQGPQGIQGIQGVQGIPGTPGSVASLVDTGWVDISGSITFQSGWSYTADGGAWTGLKARKYGLMVQLSFADISVVASKFSIATNGNIDNQVVFTNIPTTFRPDPLGNGLLTSGSAGQLAQFYVDASGALYLAAVVPDASKSAAYDNPAHTYSCGGMFIGRSS